MADHNFGGITGDSDIGGVFALGEAVLLDEWITLAVDTLSGEDHTPMIILELHGRVNKSKDTLRATYVIPVVDAGSLAGHLFHAAQRLGTQQEIEDFQLGFRLGVQGERLEEEGTDG